MWQHWKGDFGRDISASYNADSVWYPIAVVSKLERVRTREGHSWQYSIGRYGWDWSYWNNLDNVYGEGWRWDQNNGPYVDADGCDIGAYAAWRFGVYGFGPSVAGYGYGFDPTYWYQDYGFAAVYDLVGPFNCRGTSHFVRNDSVFADVEQYVPGSWPDYVDVTRIARDTVA